MTVTALPQAERIDRAAYDPDQAPTQYTENVWVTPARARAWLAERNKFNRRLSVPTVRRHRDILESGRYKLTHQGVAFDENSDLVDGQHRLTALAESSVNGVWMAVSYNVARDAFDVMDSGLKRSAGQFIPGPYANIKAAAAGMLLEFPRLVNPTKKIDTDVIREMYEEFSEEIDAAVEMAAPVYGNTKISHSIHAALLTVLLASRCPGNLVEDWCNGLATGAGLAPDDPRLHLRNRFALESKYLNSGHRPQRMAAIYLVIRAWNAFAEGEGLGRLQLPRGDVSPAAIPEIVRPLP